MSRIGIIYYRPIKPFIGRLKPFINWSIYLKKLKNFEVIWYTINASEEFLDFLNKKDIRFVNFRDIRSLLVFFKNNKNKIDIVLIDDFHIGNLKIVKKLQKLNNLKIIIYIQTLFAPRILLNTFDYNVLDFQTRIKIKILKLFPTTCFIEHYKNIFSRANNIYLVANSYLTLELLKFLYNMEVEAVIYPPVNNKIFYPVEDNNRSKHKGVFLFTGDRTGDTNYNLVKNILKILTRNTEEKIYILGNSKQILDLNNQNNTIILENIPDKTLANILRSVKFVILPQQWEQFGYLGAEATMCCTPFIAFSYTGYREIYEYTKFGILAKNSKEFIEAVNKIDNLELVPWYNIEILPWHIRNSSKELLKIIK